MIWASSEQSSFQYSVCITIGNVSENVAVSEGEVDLATSFFLLADFHRHRSVGRLRPAPQLIKGDFWERASPLGADT